MKFVINICEHCGDEVPDVGMSFCGKACAALGRNTKYAFLFQNTLITEQQLTKLNQMFDDAMCIRHSNQFENVCAFCK